MGRTLVLLSNIPHGGRQRVRKLVALPRETAVEHHAYAETVFPRLRVLHEEPAFFERSHNPRNACLAQIQLTRKLGYSALLLICIAGYQPYRIVNRSRKLLLALFFHAHTRFHLFYSIISLNFASSIIVTPRVSALVSLLPAFSPTIR